MDRRTRRSKRSSDQVIFRADPLPAIESLKPAHRKMTAGDILEMRDERVVHPCTAEGADEGQGLRGNLLRGHQSEACSDLGDELQQDGHTFLGFWRRLSQSRFRSLSRPLRTPRAASRGPLSAVSLATWRDTANLVLRPGASSAITKRTRPTRTRYRCG
jgi:hypothetical protein